MKALVAVKRVVDYNVKVRAKSDGSDVDLNNVKMAINPFCEIAVEEAVRLKEAGTVSEIVAVSVGGSGCQEQIRTALALGADRGIHVEVDGTVEPLSVAKLLKAVVEQEAPDLVIMGKQSIDGDNNQTGQMLGALTGMGQGTFASEVKVGDGSVEVVREVDGGLQTVSLKLPAIITTDLRLNEPRYASLPNIMKAKKKPLDAMMPADLGVDIQSHVELLGVTPPPERSAGIKVESIEQLVDKLKNEAKVIS
jgi:electron transfer flavoprotein beta subunit